MGLISRVSSRTYRFFFLTMPPKKAPKVSNKNKEKAKTKQVEDKTFGLKNKKGAKQQKFIEQAHKQAYLDQLDAILQPVKTERKVMLSKKQQEADKEKEVVYLTIEELVEVERLKLKNSGKKLTPVTLESFLIWKKKKKAEQKAQEEKEAKIKTKYAKEGKIVSSTGKELFAYYKDQINVDDDEEVDDIDYNACDSDQEEEAENLKKQGGFREITAETFYYEGVDAAINEELFADCDLDELADELAEL